MGPGEEVFSSLFPVSIFIAILLGVLVGVFSGFPA